MGKVVIIKGSDFSKVAVDTLPVDEGYTDIYPWASHYYPLTADSNDKIGNVDLQSSGVVFTPDGAYYDGRHLSCIFTTNYNEHFFTYGYVVSFKLIPTGLPAASMIFNSATTGPNTQADLASYPDGIYADYQIGGDNQKLRMSLLDDNWHKMALVRAEGKGALYLDGELVYIGVNPQNWDVYNAQRLFIGNSRRYIDEPTNDRPVKGYIKDFLIASKPLSEEEWKEITVYQE